VRVGQCSRSAGELFRLCDIGQACFFVHFTHMLTLQQHRGDKGREWEAHGWWFDCD